MPYTPEHKAKTRERIVESASRLFNLRGFEGVSIDEIMAEAGLTRGGFYNHFSAKEDLYAEVVTRALKERHPDCEAALGARPNVNPAHAFIRAYLSREQQERREGSCPLVALPSDVARGGDSVRHAYRQLLEYMIANLESGISVPEARRRALALAALCIGGMVVARAVDDPDLAHEIRRSARELALSLTGWQEPRVEAAE
jgi:TetR/AcrR family transcriptional repressor of nem operon